MAMSIKGYNDAARQGRAAAVDYCKDWQVEIKNEGIELATRLADKEITIEKYNALRGKLNERTKDLNACIKSINKQFGGM